MENVKERIIQEATELFLRSGVKVVTMDDVASSLGMSKRTIYEHFGDKLQLLRDCLRSHNCSKRKDLDELSQLPMVELLHRILEKAGTDALEHSREFRFAQELKKYYPTLYGEITEDGFRHGLEVVEMLVNRGKSEGIFLANTNTDIAAYLLIEQMNALENNVLVQSGRYNTAADWIELIRHALVIFFRGIATSKGIAELDAMLESVEEELKQK